MNKVLNLGLRVSLSAIIAFLLMVVVSSLFHWIDPAFSLDIVDMLARWSPSAWLLLALATAIVKVALSRLRPFRGASRGNCSPEHPPSE